MSEGDIDMTKAEDKHFILQIALKCADISNPARGWKTCYKWARRVCDEFFQQGGCLFCLITVGSIGSNMYICSINMFFLSRRLL